jgi:DNA-binding MarR family transcriptional regulator
MARQVIADATLDSDVEVVLAASRVLVGVAAQSLAPTEEVLSVPQSRALMILATRGPMTLTKLAGEMAVHPSNATRACDRLVAAGLLDRRDNPADRRHLQLTLTPAGHTLIDEVVARRRSAIAAILERMTPAHRQALSSALADFAAAGGEPPPGTLGTLGWIS